jgi:hypothetical protein
MPLLAPMACDVTGPATLSNHVREQRRATTAASFPLLQVVRVSPSFTSGSALLAVPARETARDRELRVPTRAAMLAGNRDPFVSVSVGRRTDDCAGGDDAAERVAEAASTASPAVFKRGQRSRAIGSDRKRVAGGGVLVPSRFANGSWLSFADVTGRMQP